jgi:hypothetical protein
MANNTAVTQDVFGPCTSLVIKAQRDLYRLRNHVCLTSSSSGLRTEKFMVPPRLATYLIRSISLSQVEYDSFQNSFSNPTRLCSQFPKGVSCVEQKQPTITFLMEIYYHNNHDHPFPFFSCTIKKYNT